VNRAVRLAGLLGLWVVIGALLGLFAAVTVPALFGYHSLTVRSGSMEPSISAGDVVVVEDVMPLDVKIGDIVSFKDPEDPARIVTHRVRDMEVHAGTVRFTTRGDANTGAERWYVDVEGTIGRVRYRVWKLGYVIGLVGTGWGRLGLVVAPVLLLGGVELRRIWRPTIPPAPAHEDEHALPA
jgi:signal peptidase